MTAPLALLAFAMLMGKLGPLVLGRRGWTTRSPWLGIVMWQAVTASVFASLLLAGLTLAVPELPARESLAEFFHACSVALREQYSTPGGVLLSVAGGALAGGLLARFVFMLASVARRSRRDRAHQGDLLSLVCSPHPQPNVVVVDHDAAAVYCLPGRRRQIVVTRGAVSALSEDELDQVLAHERAHIRARHHLVLMLAEALSATFGHRFGFEAARQQIAELAEMHADDAAEQSKRTELATALIVLASAARPAGALGASGGSALVRVQRLTTPAQPLSWASQQLLIALSAGALLAPFAIAVAPAITAVLMDYCPVLLPSLAR